MDIPPRIPSHSPREPGLMAWWPMLVVLTLVIVPGSAYFIHQTVQSVRLHGDAEQMRGEITHETKLIATIEIGAKEELGKLESALLRPENYEHLEDFLDYIEGRLEDLSEIAGLVKNASENLAEAEERVNRTLYSDNRAELDIAEFSLDLAKKKIVEARDLLASYLRMR